MADKLQFVIILRTNGGGSVVNVCNGSKREQAVDFARGKADGLGTHGITVNSTEIVPVLEVVDLDAAKKKGG